MTTRQPSRSRAGEPTEALMVNDVEGRANRTVAVLGPIPRDQIVTHAGDSFEKYGCVLYVHLSREETERQIRAAYGPRS